MQVQNIIVTNNGVEPFSKSWDSAMYSFPPGEPVIIPEGAAKYLFGYAMGPVEREACLRRNGWMNTSDPVTSDKHADAVKRLDAFVFQKLEAGAFKQDGKAPKGETFLRGPQTLHLPKADSDKTANRRQPPA